MEDFKKLITFAAKKQASDLHLVTGAVPHVRIDGTLFPVKKPLITVKDTEALASHLLSKEQLNRLRENGDVDFGFITAGRSLRVNVHRQSGGYGFSIRLISEVPPTPEEIGLTDVTLEQAMPENGLVIVSGAAGTGKSTTVAAILHAISEQKRQHIITLEDPIEYRFHNTKSLVEQRELGTDFPTFASGLKHILRQDPNVIMLGEMRDPESMELALTAAETGHLVLTTLHAPNATEVVERIVNVFEGAKQQQILIQLAETLRLVIAQTLVPGKEGGRVAVREILLPTNAVQNAIRQNKLSTITSAIETGRKYGMVSMKQARADLASQGIIAYGDR